MIETQRLALQKWVDGHRAAFGTMHADPQVMADLGGPIDRAASDLKFERYRTAQREYGISRWAVESPDGVFLGYAGVMPRMSEDHPLGQHFEIGWRFTRSAWGHGYATEAAKAALDHALGILPETEIISYTSPDNLKSQAVTARLGLVRDTGRDFETASADGRVWHGLVWLVWPSS